MSGVWAVVPVKCFARGKSRLAGLLGKGAREALARAFCEHVLGELGELAERDELAGVLVVTDCQRVERLAEERGAEVVRDGKDGPLGAIVDEALAMLARRGARAAIVLMSDLPRLEADDVRRLVAALADASLVLAPDHLGEGTNALGLAPPDLLRTCFGTRDSFVRHQARAESAGILAAVYRSDGVAWDVDSPEDLALYRAYALRGARLRWKRKRSSRVSAP